MVRILLTGHGGSYNRGCEALVRSTVEIIRQQLGAADITLLSFNPEEDWALLQPDLPDLHIPDIRTDFPKRYTLNWLRNSVRRYVTPGFPTPITYYNRLVFDDNDLVISIGGDNFSDDYGGPDRFFRELAFAKSRGALTVIWGASIGPFRDAQQEKKWAREFRKIDLITVRETRSLRYLQDLGLSENVRLVADPAFLLPAVSKKDADFSLPQSAQVVGMNVSDLVPKYGLTREQYLEELVAFSEQLLAEKDTHLFLIPHVFGGALNNDEVMVQRLADRLINLERVSWTDSSFNVCQLKQCIAQCHYFIGARTHSTLASLSSAIPTLSVAYSTKAYGINQDLFGHLDYVLPISELNRQALMNKFYLLKEKRSEIIEQLKVRVPEMQRLALQGGAFLANLLRENGKGLKD